MNPLSLRLAALLVASWWLAGCVPPSLRPAPRATAEERRDFETARGLGTRGAAAEAKALELFLARWPRGALADDAGLRLAELELAAGRRTAARSRLEALLRAHPKADRSASARLLLARLQHEDRDAEAAWRTIMDLQLPLLDEDERRRAHRLLADLARERGEIAHELHWLTRVAADAGDPQAAAAAEERIGAIVARLDRDGLVRAAERLNRRKPAARLWLEEVERALQAGDAKGAQAALARAAKLPLSPEEARRHVALEQGLAVGELEPAQAVLPPSLGEVAAQPLPAFARASGTLGVVLPLTGSLANVAEQSLRGILLAANVFRPDASGDGGVRVLVRDSGGRPEAASAAVEELAREKGLSAVIGPLMVEEARAAGDAAERAGVPLLSLTRQEEVTRGHTQVFRLGTTRRMEAEALAEHAVGQLGATRFAILYPADAYGREFRALFWRAVEARGGRVVGVAAYEPGDTDFAEPIRRLVGYELLTPEEKGRLAQRRALLTRAKRQTSEKAAELRAQAAGLLAPDGTPLPPIVDFEAIFIPDSHDKVVLIAPQLAFHDVDGVRLLGPSGWYHPDLLRIGGRHVERAVFTAAFDPASPYPTVQDFARRYEQAYGEPPSVFAAESFDATNLALLQLLSGRERPGDLRQGLLQVRAFPGVSGVTAMRPDGNAAKRPFLVGVERGEFVSLP